jgi:hypothetical protein
VYIGGICGQAYCANISYCFNNGNVVGIISKYSGGYVSSYSAVGGIIGYTSGTSYNSTKVHNCYNVGTIKVAKDNVDGIDITSSSDRCTGIAYIYNYTVMSTCYNTQPAYYGISSSTVTNCYYLNGSGKDCTGATALSDAQMKLTSTYNGFDFNNVWVLNPNAVNPYPQLRDNIQDQNEGVDLIRVVALPQTTTYYTGEALNLQGALIEIVYPSGKTEMMAITEDMISGYDPNSAKEQTITVKYKERHPPLPLPWLKDPR